MDEAIVNLTDGEDDEEIAAIEARAERRISPRPPTAENAERETPRDLFDLLDQEFSFGLDACARPGNAKCARWLGEQADGTFVDGLSADWSTCSGGRAVFCNPPYSRGQLRRWLEKAHEARRQGATVVLLIPGDRSTKAWQRYVPGEEVRDLKQRLDYGVGAGAKFASAVVVLRPFVPEVPWVVTPASPMRPSERLLRAQVFDQARDIRRLEAAAHAAIVRADRLAAKVARLQAHVDVERMRATEWRDKFKARRAKREQADG